MCLWHLGKVYASFHWDMYLNVGLLLEVGVLSFCLLVVLRTDLNKIFSCWIPSSRKRWVTWDITASLPMWVESSIWLMTFHWHHVGSSNLSSLIHHPLGSLLNPLCLAQSVSIEVYLELVSGQRGLGKWEAKRS